MTSTLDFLAQLVAFPTVSAASNLPLIDYVQDYLVARGFTVHRIPDPTGQKAGLFARIGPAGAGGVMLSAHSDVVPVEGQSWTADPFALRRDGGRVYGRGTTDMKGFVACVLAFADRLSGRPLAEPLKIALSWDEEVGCVGIPHMLPHLAGTIGVPRLCIVGEPTGLRVATGHKGKATFRVSFPGTAGHSSMAPDYLNALHPAAEFLTGLRALQDRVAAEGPHDPAYDIPYTTLHAGRLSGGSALNTVPERAELALEYRPVPRHDPAVLDAALADLAVAAMRPWTVRFPEARIAVTRTGGYPGLDNDPRAPEVAEVAAFSGEAGVTTVGYGTEAGYFAEAGIPTLVCGPGSMTQGHTADEFIEIGQIGRCDAMMDRIGAALAG